MKNKKINLLILFLLTVTGIAILIVYNRLPQEIPSHWGVNGQIDAYKDKSYIWVVYALIWGLNALFIIASIIDPKRDNFKKFQKSFDIFRLIMTIFFILILVLIILTSITNEKIEVSKIISILVGLLLAIIGNYMPKFKHNYTMGIKTPWTLANEVVWTKTHRMAAPLWVIGGILIAISNLFIKSEFSIKIIITTVIIISIIPAIYSYIIFIKEKHN